MLDKDEVVLVIGTTCLEVPPENYGGTELIIYNLCKEIASRGYTVALASPKGTEIEDVQIIETVEPSNDRDCFSREPDAYRIYASALPDADVIFDHSWRKFSYIGKSANPDIMSDTPVIGIWHSSPSVKQGPPVENPCFVSVSENCANKWENFTGIRTKYAHNGIDVDRYELRENHWKDGEYVITLNRIMENKGIQEFVQLSHETETDFVVAGEDKFVGDGEYVHKIMAMCASSEYGRYRGTVEHKEKMRLLREAKATVLTPKSNYVEAFGLAAVESMASGTPPLVLDNAGLTEIVSTIDENLVCKNFADMKYKLKNLDDITDVTPEQLRKCAKENFSVEEMTDQYLELADEALDNPW